MKARPLPTVICQALEAFRAALDGLRVKHDIQPPESYTTLVKSREVLLRELRRAQDACSGSASHIRMELLFKKNHPEPLVLVTAEYQAPPTTDEKIERAHALEHVHAMGDWVTSALGGFEEPADLAMGERFAEEALRMSARANGQARGV
jgi:hypothetical protein